MDCIQVKIENDYARNSPNDSLCQLNQTEPISIVSKSRRSLSENRKSVSSCSESGFVSPLHQFSANKTGQSIRYKL